MSLISYIYIGKIQKFTIWAKYKKKKECLLSIYRKIPYLQNAYIQKNTYSKYYDKIYKKRKAIFSHNLGSDIYKSIIFPIYRNTMGWGKAKEKEMVSIYI